MVGILRLTQKQKNKLTNGSVNYINFDKTTMIKKVTLTIVARFCVMFIIVFGAIQVPYLKNIHIFLQMLFLVFYLIYFIAYMPYFSVMNSFDSKYIYHIFEKRVYIKEKRIKAIFEILANKYLKLEGKCSDRAYNWIRISANILIIIIDITLLILENQFQWSYTVTFFLYSIVSLLICIIVFLIINCIDLIVGLLLASFHLKIVYLCLMIGLAVYDILIAFFYIDTLIDCLYGFVGQINFPLNISGALEFYDDFLQGIGVYAITLACKRIKNDSNKNYYKRFERFLTIFIFMFSFYGYEIIYQVFVSALVQFSLDIDNMSKKIRINGNLKNDMK